MGRESSRLYTGDPASTRDRMKPGTGRRGNVKRWNTKLSSIGRKFSSKLVQDRKPSRWLNARSKVDCAGVEDVVARPSKTASSRGSESWTCPEDVGVVKGCWIGTDKPASCKGSTSTEQSLCWTGTGKPASRKGSTSTEQSRKTWAL